MMNTRRQFFSLFAAGLAFLGFRNRCGAKIAAPPKPEVPQLDFDILAQAIGDVEFWTNKWSGPRCVGDWVVRHFLAKYDGMIPRETITEIYEREYALAWVWRGGLDAWLETRRPSACSSWPQYAAATEFAFTVHDHYLQLLKEKRA